MSTYSLESKYGVATLQIALGDGVSGALSQIPKLLDSFLKRDDPPALVVEVFYV